MKLDKFILHKGNERHLDLIYKNTIDGVTKFSFVINNENKMFFGATNENNTLRSVEDVELKIIKEDLKHIQKKHIKNFNEFKNEIINKIDDALVSRIKLAAKWACESHMFDNL